MRKKISRRKKLKLAPIVPVFVATIGVVAIAVILFFSLGLASKAGRVTTAAVESSCTLPVANTTFIKSFRLLVFTKVNGAWPTKDGGYIVSGTTDPNIMFIPPDGFVAKLDKQGSIQWMKFLKTKNGAGVGNTLGEEDVQSIIELKNGGYLMASKVWGFITTAESSSGVEVNKILLTKLDKSGNLVWNKSITGFTEDIKNSLLETNDNNLLFHANLNNLAPSKRGEDSEVYNDLPFSSLKVFKLDQNGKMLWSKEIKNFIARKNDSYLTQASDGGYVIAGNLGETNPEKELPYNFDTYPGLAKFDKDFNLEWAKSLEGIPLEMAAAIPTADGGYTLGTKQIRQGAILIGGFVRTQDNGYVVLGNLSSMSMMSDSLDLKSGTPHSYLAAIKFNSFGGLEWAKRITLSYNAFTGPMTKYSTALTPDNNILIAGSFAWADEDYTVKTKAVSDLQKAYYAKYGEMEVLKELKDRSAQSREDWKKVQEAIDIAQAAYRSATLVMKTDQNLNPIWTKVVNPQRAVTNFVLKPTSDNGAILAGEYEPNVIKSVVFGNKTYYMDGLLIKLDASGNTKNGAGWIVDYNGKIVTETMTPYVTSNNLSAQVGSYKAKFVDRKPEFSLYKKSKVTTYAAFNSSKSTLCPQAPAVSANGSPLQNSTSTSDAQRTWPQINYERAVPGELVNEKSRILDGELMPILNRLFGNHVKMTDNMDGALLHYVFDRQVVQDDRQAVKKYLEGLGYKTQDEEGVYQLTMSKTGYFLIMTFSINNTNKGFMEVTY
ncbi:MAG: hypothetical protein PHC70_05040 [Patescibacteria group bacterium]|nr:hypothetical protein [Patescibacteria group bacterium]